MSYQFLWLTRRPMHASIDRRGRLTFTALLPQATKEIVAEMKSLVAARSTRAVPEHKRIDARRARLACVLRKGHLTLAIDIRGQNQEYAVKQVLNLINDMFVALHESHPEYLVEHFGISQE